MQPHERESFPAELMESLLRAVRTAPTTEEARNRQIYESSVGFAGGDRLLTLNLSGRVMLRPDDYETAELILTRLGLSKERIGEKITHEKEHTQKAKELGMEVLYLFVSITRNEKGKHVVALETIMEGENRNAALEVLKAPQDLSRTDKDILGQINGG